MTCISQNLLVQQTTGREGSAHSLAVLVVMDHQTSEREISTGFLADTVVWSWTIGPVEWSSTGPLADTTVWSQIIRPVEWSSTGLLAGTVVWSWTTGPLDQQKGEFSGPLADTVVWSWTTGTMDGRFLWSISRYSGLVTDHWNSGRVLLVRWQIQWPGHGPLVQRKGEFPGPLADIVVWSQTTGPMEGSFTGSLAFKHDNHYFLFFYFQSLKECKQNTTLKGSMTEQPGECDRAQAKGMQQNMAC